MAGKLDPTQSQQGITRRQVLLGAAAIGGTLVAMPLLDAGIRRAAANPFAKEEFHGVGDFGEPVPPERIIYATCENCYGFCPIKVELTDAAETGGKTYIRKIAGNPYSALSTEPYAPIPYETSPADAAKGVGNLPVDGRAERGGRVCLKGQAGIQTAYDAYRLAQPLKRVGPRGSGKWQTISWDQAMQEISVAMKPYLGFAHQEEVMADWEKVEAGEMPKEVFAARYREVLIDTEHPDLGPKVNQIAMIGGRGDTFFERLFEQGLGSRNLFNRGSICNISGIYANIRSHDNVYGKKRLMADFAHCEYLIVFGMNPLTASKSPTFLAPRVSNALDRGMKMVVVDPRLSKTAEKAHQWVPVKPGQDIALIFGMMRWIIENQRYDAKYLTNPNKAAATKDGEPTWSDATYLINLSRPERPRLRAQDLGLGDDKQFVVLEGGQPALAEKAAEGQLEVDTELGGVKVKSTFTLLKERVFERTLAEYAEMCGVPEKTIVQMADEFTSHGKRAVVMAYRGLSQHTNGFYTIYAANMLNFLIGNNDWKGGENSFANRFIEVTGRYDLDMVPGGREAWGTSMIRESAKYEDSTLFKRDGYPAKRRWSALGGGRPHEMIPSAVEGYPYPLKVLFLNRISPLESMPGGQYQVEMLKDETKIPTVVAIDVTIGGTTQFADYILPEPTYLERFNLEQRPNQHPKESHIAQPAIWVMDGPRPSEDIWIDLIKRLHLPGAGDGAFPDGTSMHWAGTYYLRMIANIATDIKAVPDASDEEERIFLEARRRALGSQFDEQQWRAAVKPEDWRKVIYVLNRGGRFAKVDQVYEGQWLKMRYGRLCNFYDEGVAASKDSFSGQYNAGIPRLEPVRFYDGKPVQDSLPLQLISWKSNFMGTHRTVSNPWLREIRDTNPLWIHPGDAQARGIKHGDRIRIRSVSGTVETEAYVTEAIRPGIVGADFSGGHEIYGAPVEIDGEKIAVAPGYGHLPFDLRKTGNEPTGYAPDRFTGFRINDLMRQDEYLGKGNPLVDNIGGSVSQLDTMVEIEKV